MNNLLPSTTQWIQEHYGIVIQQHQMKRIEVALNRLQERLNLSGADALLKALQGGESKIIEEIVDVITVQESYFFRDSSLFTLLEEDIIPLLIEKKLANNNKVIRIWSAGCARGEEIYSMAMLLEKMIPDSDKWALTLVGSDINAVAIAEAKRAIYTKASMRVIDKETQARYFTEKDQHFYLNEKIKSRVKFHQQNLSIVDVDPIPFDIILCRNVFIYFSPQAINNALALFTNCLSPEGYLFLGPSDFVNYSKNPLKLHFERGVTYFTHPQLAPAAQQQVVTSKKPNAIKPYSQKQTNSADQLFTIKELLNKNPAAALKLIDTYTDNPSALLYQYKVEALVALNDNITAKEFCQLALKQDPLNYVCYFYLGLIQFENGDCEAAELSFRNAVISRTEGVEAHFYLAQIALLQNKPQKALGELTKTLELAKKLATKSLLLGFAYDSMVDVIVNLEQEITHLSKLSNAGEAK